MKTILYLNHRYCTKLSDLKSIVKYASTKKDESIMTEFLTVFRDGILESWLQDLSKLDKSASGYLKELEHIKTECTCNDIIKPLTRLFCTSFYEFDIQTMDYIEIQNKITIYSELCGVQSFNQIDCVTIPDDVHQFKITLYINVKKSRNDRIQISINGEDFIVSLAEKDKTIQLSCIISRINSLPYQPIVVKTKDTFLKSIKVLEVVDLGLSVKWYGQNIGANSIYEKGDYYGWGQVDPEKVKIDYSYDIAGNPVLDIATCKFGEKWRIPSADQWRELIAKCNWLYACDSEKDGFWVVSKLNSKKIFLPLSGNKLPDNSLSGEQACFYWSSQSKYKSYSENAEAFMINQFDRNPYIFSLKKTTRLLIRPIYTE